jgi:hypothetical protein
LGSKLNNRWKKYDDVPVNQETAPNMFLDCFYPIHVSIGMKIEAGLLECDRLDRHQTVIMWILRSETARSGKKAIRRKDIVRLMTS